MRNVGDQDYCYTCSFSMVRKMLRNEIRIKNVVIFINRNEEKVSFFSCNFRVLTKKLNWWVPVLWCWVFSQYMDNLFSAIFVKIGSKRICFEYHPCFSIKISERTTICRRFREAARMRTVHCGMQGIIYMLLISLRKRYTVCNIFRLVQSWLVLCQVNVDVLLRPPPSSCHLKRSAGRSVFGPQWRV